MQLPIRKSDLFKKRDDGPLHITKEGFEQLKRKLERLEKGVPEMIAEVSRTAGFGDRSENAEYQAAKSLLRRTYRSIYFIKDQLKRAVIIDTGPHTSGRVEIGSTVVVEVKGERKTFQIVGPHETRPAQGRISFQSPLGAALMKHGVGDEMTLTTPGGVQLYRILEVR